MILITGATGLTGRYLLDLIDNDPNIPNEQVVCYVRKSSDILGLQEKGFQIAYGEDITDRDSLNAACHGVNTIIHIVQMRHSPLVVDAAVENSVHRLIIVGTTGVFSQYQMYSDEYKVAESYITGKCTVPFVVLRPTMIYGASNDKNMNKLLRFLNRFRFFPVFGEGKGKMQPIYYQDLARALFQVLKRPALENKFYNLAGRNALTYYELLNIAAQELGKKCFILKIPFGLAESLVGFYNKFSKNPKVRVEQVRRLNEDKAFDYTAATEDFGFDPVDFRTGIRQQIKVMFDI